MQYSLEQLEAFVAVAEHLSFSIAAKKLGKAQSTISLSVANLEADIGVELFDRNGKSPELSQAGRALLSEAKSVLLHCQNFSERAMTMFRGEESTISLALDGTVPRDIIGKGLEELAHKFPFVEVTIVSPRESGTIEMVVKKEVDLAIGLVNYTYPSTIGYYRLGQIELVNVVHKDHPLAKVETVSYSLLNSIRHLIYAPNAGRIPTNQQLNCFSQWNLFSYDMMIELLLCKMGWGFLPRYMVERYLEQGDLVTISFEPFPITPWRMNVDIVWSVEVNHGNASFWLKEFLGKTKGLSSYIF